MNDPKRILVFQTAYLGDVVLTTPLLSALKDKYPHAELDIVVQPQWRDIVSHHPGLRKVLTFAKRGAQSGLLGTWQFARLLAKENYDLALCPHPSFRSALILRLAGISRRIGFQDSAGAFFFTTKIKRDKSLHEVERVLSLLSPLGGIAGDPPRPMISLGQDVDSKAILEKFNIKPGAKLAGLHPGSVWATKRWLPERFAELGLRLSDRFDHILVFGVPGETDLAGEVAGGAGPKAVNLAGRLNIAELAAVLKKLELFVTNDSGPMHMAAALDVPVVAVFGSTVRRFGYTPYAARSRVVETELACRPCGPHGFRKCPLVHFRCMRDIGTDQVKSACDELLNEVG